MITCNALVVDHISFEDKKGKEVNYTILIVHVGDYGNYKCSIPKDESLKLLSEVKVNVSYEYGKFVVDSIVK